MISQANCDVGLGGRKLKIQQKPFKSSTIYLSLNKPQSSHLSAFKKKVFNSLTPHPQHLPQKVSKISCEPAEAIESRDEPNRVSARPSLKQPLVKLNE